MSEHTPDRYKAGPGGSWGGGAPRALLRRIREIMASAGPGQRRLDQIVQVIAANMVAEVCSIYLERDDAMELFATEGLKKTAVHLVRLAPGEGLVGVVAQTARPVALADAQSHPSFSFQPAAGEEPYQSFLGVPILRGGRVVGVLVVQNKAARDYHDEEIEALQTVAMVLAEIVSSSDLQSPPLLEGVAVRRRAAEIVSGVVFSEGLAEGPVVYHDPVVDAAPLFAEDPAAERERLETALKTMLDSIDALLSGPHIGGEPREVLETYRLFAEDAGWRRRLFEGVRNGLTAEAAVAQARSQDRARMQRASDAYLRERLHDLEDLDNRLLRHLGDEGLAEASKGSILIARNIGPAELLEYGAAGVAGVVLEEGSETSHAAIVARAMGIPLVGRVEGLQDIVGSGDVVLVDGIHGAVHVRPAEAQREEFGERISARLGELRRYERLRSQDTVTRDGVRMHLLMNAGLALDMDQFAASGAEGVGLFRTEFQFMVSDKLPGQRAQTELYRTVLDKAAGRPVTFRTLDIGGDKILPYMRGDRSENPALGWRGLRMALDRPALLRHQLRALIKAAGGRSLRVMFPLVATADEFEQARAWVDKELELAQSRGWPSPERVAVGAMIEAPSLVYDLDPLLKQADFVSLGLNDLMQFFFAADRTNVRAYDRYDVLSPPALSFLESIAERCAAYERELTICGEAAGLIDEAVVFAALGYRRLSMHASRIGPVKAALMGVSLGEARDLIKSARAKGGQAIRQGLDEIMGAGADSIAALD